MSKFVKWNGFRWSFWFDVKLAGVLFWLSALSPFAFLLLYHIKSDWFTPLFLDRRLYSNVFYFFDIIFPVFSAFTVLLSAAPCFENQSSSFLYTLPVPRAFFIMIRWLRMTGVLLIPNLLSLYILYLSFNETIRNQLVFSDFILLTVPNTVFLSGLALFLVTLCKKTFYSAVILGGYLLSDISTMGMLFGKMTLYINLSPVSYSMGIILNNRLIFLVAGFALVVLSYIIFSSKHYRMRI